VREDGPRRRAVADEDHKVDVGERVQARRAGNVPQVAKEDTVVLRADAREQDARRRVGSCTHVS
jgi:hypothetical protein